MNQFSIALICMTFTSIFSFGQSEMNTQTAIKIINISAHGPSMVLRIQKYATGV